MSVESENPRDASRFEMTIPRVSASYPLPSSLQLRSFCYRTPNATTPAAVVSDTLGLWAGSRA